jgi:hypothetical protein
MVIASIIDRFSGRWSGHDATMAASPDLDLTPSDNTTVVSVLASFEAAGFGPSLFATDDGCVRCTVCNETFDPEQMQVEAIRRLEGASDPDEEVAIVAATCLKCGKPGTMVVGYGPTASAGEADVLKHLAGVHRPGTPVAPMQQGEKGVPPIAPSDTSHDGAG